MQIGRPVFALAIGAVLVVGASGCTTTSGTQGAADATATSSAASSTSTSTSTSPSSGVPADAFDPVVALVVERLETAPEVAASKLFSGQPVTDEAREKVVLDTAGTTAQEAGADVDYVTAVFADQIAASKQVQQSLLDAWAAGTASAPTSAPDLATEVRPVLDRITTELVPALAAVQDLRGSAGCTDAVDRSVANAAPSTPEVAAALPTAVAHLCG